VTDPSPSNDSGRPAVLLSCEPPATSGWRASCPLRFRLLMLLSCAGTLQVMCLLGLIPEVLPASALLLGSVVIGLAAAMLCGRATAIRVAVGAAAACLTLAAADAVLRLDPPLTLRYRPEELFLNRWPRMETLGRYSAGAVFSALSFGDLSAASGRPDLRCYRYITFRADRFGFPNDAATGGPVRVLLIGDSFGAGSGTTQEKTWPVILRRRYGVSLYNLSIPESGPWHELMTLKSELPRIERLDGTTVLWAIFSGNDLDDRFENEMEPQLSDSLVRQWLVRAASFRNRSPIRQLCTRAFVAFRSGRRPPIFRPLPDGRPFLFRRGYAEAARRSVRDIESHPNFPLLDKVFREMRNFSTANRLDVAVVVLPSKEEVYGWILDGAARRDSDAVPSPFALVIHRLSEVNGFRFADLKPAMVREAGRLLDEGGGVLWWPDDTHWNEAGHAFAAREVFQTLLQPAVAR